MNCCQTQNYDGFFDRKTAEKELKEYHKKGPDKTTKILIEALKNEGVKGMMLLDIGGGIGAIQHELLKDGVRSVIGVDGSNAYVEAAQEETRRQGNADRVSYHYGNFVELAYKISQSDVVTLNRVICCYPDVWSLVGLSSEKARKFYGLIYPRDTWWVKMGVAMVNFFLWVLRKNFRAFVHSTETVDKMIRRAGLAQRFYHKTFVWQVVVYGKI